MLYVSSLRGNTRRHVTCLCEYVSMTTVNQWFPSPLVRELYLHWEPISSSTDISWNMRCLLKNGYTHSLWDMVKPLQYMTVYMFICESICIPSDFGLTIRRWYLLIHTQCFETLPCGSRTLPEYFIFADQRKFKINYTYSYVQDMVAYSLIKINNNFSGTFIHANHFYTHSQ